MYDFKRLEELAWIALIAGGTFLLEWAITFDPDIVTDWRAYVIAAASGLLRAIVGAVLANVRRPS